MTLYQTSRHFLQRTQTSFHPPRICCHLPGVVILPEPTISIHHWCRPPGNEIFSDCCRICHLTRAFLRCSGWYGRIHWDFITPVWKVLFRVNESARGQRHSVHPIRPSRSCWQAFPKLLPPADFARSLSRNHSLCIRPIAVTDAACRPGSGRHSQAALDWPHVSATCESSFFAPETWRQNACRPEPDV